MKNSEKLVLIFNDARECDQIWIKDAVTELGVRCLWIDEKDPYQGNIKIEIDGQASRIQLGSGICTIVPNSIVGVWHRWQLPSSYPEPGSREAFIRSEWKYFWKFFAQSITRHRWMNGKHSVEKATDRLHQLEVARSVGMSIPRTLVAIEPTEIFSFIEDVGGFGVVKVLGSGRPQESPGRKLMTASLTASDLKAHGRYEAPALVQERLNFELEIRCTVVDSEVYCASIKPIADHVDIKHSILAGTRFKRASMPQRVKNQLIEITNSLGLRYAAIDLGITKREDLIFIEVNPSGMYQNIEVDTSMPITEAIARALTQGDRNDSY